MSNSSAGENVKVLRKAHYKKNAVDFNNYLNNLIEFEDVKEMAEAETVLFKDGDKVFIVKYCHDVSMGNGDLVKLIESHGGNPELAIKEYDRYMSVNLKSLCQTAGKQANNDPVKSDEQTERYREEFDKWYYEKSSDYYGYDVPNSHLFEIYCAGRSSADDKIDELTRQLSEIKEALEFYADRDNWVSYPTSSNPDCASFLEVFHVEKDGGERARKTLREIE